MLQKPVLVGNLKFSNGTLLPTRRTRCVNYRCINDGSGGHFHAALSQIGVYGFEEFFAEIVLLKQMQKLADRRFVRNGRLPKIDSSKPAH